MYEKYECRRACCILCQIPLDSDIYQLKLIPVSSGHPRRPSTSTLSNDVPSIMNLNDRHEDKELEARIQFYENTMVKSNRSLVVSLKKSTIGNNRFT